MKKLILLIFVGSSALCFGQMAVVDAGVNGQLATQLSTSASQLAQLEQSYELIKKTADNVEKVTSYVQSVNDIKSVIDLQKEAVNNINLIMRNKGSQKGVAKNLTGILQGISRHITNINKVITSGFFTMTDKERLDFFREEKSIIFSQVAKTRGMANPYK